MAIIYLHQKQTIRGHMDDLILSYKNSKHRAIRMSPSYMMVVDELRLGISIDTSGTRQGSRDGT